MKGESRDEIKEHFIAWKIAEGFDEQLAGFFWQEHHNYGSLKSKEEYVLLETHTSEGYESFREANNLADCLIIDQYIKKTENFDIRDESVRRGVMTGKNNVHYYDNIKPVYKLLIDSLIKAQSGTYMSAFILLRTAIEGTIKAGLRARIRDEESEKLYENFDSITTEGEWGTYLELKENGGERVKIDDLGLSKLSKIAGDLGVTSPVGNVYKEFDLWNFNDYTHINQSAVQACKTHPLQHREFILKRWQLFAKMYLSAKQILLLSTHFFSKTLEWFEPKELDLELTDICKYFPLYAEALIPDGLIRKCISCGKKLTTKKLELQRGRCYTCYSEDAQSSV